MRWLAADSARCPVVPLACVSRPVWPRRGLLLRGPLPMGSPGTAAKLGPFPVQSIGLSCSRIARKSQTWIVFSSERLTISRVPSGVKQTGTYQVGSGLVRRATSRPVSVSTNRTTPKTPLRAIKRLSGLKATVRFEAAPRPPGAYLPELGVRPVAGCEPAAIRTEPGTGCALQRQLMDLPTGVGVPNAGAVGPAIRKVAARCHPAAVRADGGKANIVLRAKLEASLRMLAVNQTW